MPEVPHKAYSNTVPTAGMNIALPANSRTTESETPAVLNHAHLWLVLVAG